jgi:hypothetical protein
MTDQATVTAEDIELLKRYRAAQSQKGKVGGKSRSAAKVRAARANGKLANRARLERGVVHEGVVHEPQESQQGRAGEPDPAV